MRHAPTAFRRWWHGATIATLLASVAVASAVVPSGWALAAAGDPGATLPFTSYEAEAGTLGGGATAVSLTVGADHAVLQPGAGGVRARVRAAHRHRPERAVDEQHRRADQRDQRPR